MADDRRVPGTAEALEARLAALGGAIEWPTAPDIAGRVGDRLRTRTPSRASTGWWASLRPVRRALVAAAALALLLAAGVAALTLLLPGLRLVTLPPGTSLPPVVASPTAAGSAGSPLGWSLGLGTAVAPDEAERSVDFEPLLPNDPSVGPPDEAYTALGRLNLLWRASPTLPETAADGVGLVVTELDGRVDEGWYEKLLLAGGTTVEEVAVGAMHGWWVTGDPHQLVYVDARGRAVEETRRVVGDVLIWRRDGVTIRVESALGREATIRLAETFTATP